MYFTGVREAPDKRDCGKGGKENGGGGVSEKGRHLDVRSPTLIVTFRLSILGTFVYSKMHAPLNLGLSS